MNIKILNITFGDKIYYQTPIMLPISAGSKREGITNDGEGDNISDKNARYGELTAVYWAWKNLKDIDIIGISHYRRYIMPSKFAFIKTFYDITWDKFNAKEYNVDPLIEELKSKDFVITKKWHFEGISIREQYLQHHPFPEDLDTLRNVLCKLHPEVVESYDNYLKGSDTYTCCMFITSWEQFDKLCSWMFPVLFELEKQLDFSKYDKYQTRMIAFLYERLLNVYFDYYKMEMVEYPFYFINDQCTKSIWRQNIGAYIWTIITKTKRLLNINKRH